MKKAWTICLSLVLGVVPGVMAEEPAQGEFPVYVGRAVCVECHPLPHAPGSSAPGNDNRAEGQPYAASPGSLARGKPCTLEQIPKHDRTYELLSKDDARSIAAALCPA